MGFAQEVQACATVLDRNNSADLWLAAIAAATTACVWASVRGRLMIEAAARCLPLGFVLPLVTFLHRTLRLSHPPDRDCCWRIL
jgi:hypothetical protein